MHLDPSLKRIPLLRQLASSFETLQSVDPVEALRRQLAVLEPTVRGLLNIHNPSVAIVREKLDAMEAIVASIPDDSAPGLAAEWRAKMTAWWLEFSNQQEAVLFSSSAAVVVVEKAAARMLVAEKEKKKEEDESELVQPSSPPPQTRPSAPYQEPVIFPKSSVEQSATSLGQQFISLRDGSFCSASMTHFQRLTPVEDGSTVEESSGESEPEGRRTSQELARRRVSTTATADQEDHHQMKTAWSSSANKSDACSTAAAAAAADAELIYDAGESKMAGLMAIQFFSKGH